MDIVTKDTGESKLYTFDFSPELGTGEVLISVVGVSQYEPAGAGQDLVTTTDFTLGGTNLLSPYVQLLVSGGVAGKIYQLECKANTSASQVLIVHGAVAVIA